MALFGILVELDADTADRFAREIDGPDQLTDIIVPGPLSERRTSQECSILFVAIIKYTDHCCISCIRLIFQHPKINVVKLGIGIEVEKEIATFGIKSFYYCQSFFPHLF